MRKLCGGETLPDPEPQKSSTKPFLVCSSQIQTALCNVSDPSFYTTQAWFYSQTQSLHSVVVSLSSSSSRLFLRCSHAFSVPGTIWSPPVKTDQPYWERISKIIEPSPELPNRVFATDMGVIYLFKQGFQVIRISRYGKYCLGHPSLQFHRLQDKPLLVECPVCVSPPSSATQDPQFCLLLKSEPMFPCYAIRYSSFWLGLSHLCFFKNVNPECLFFHPGVFLAWR